MQTLRFEVQMCDETGGYVARWDDPEGGGITTQGDSFAELDAMVRDAVDAYFADREKPAGLRLHFVDDPVLVVA
jgi:predicted RNase H-like HicB family nuclease